MEAFDLVFTDFKIPCMMGDELSEVIKTRWPATLARGIKLVHAAPHLLQLFSLRRQSPARQTAASRESPEPRAQDSDLPCPGEWECEPACPLEACSRPVHRAPNATMLPSPSARSRSVYGLARAATALCRPVILPLRILFRISM